MNDYEKPEYYTEAERVLLSRRRADLSQAEAADLFDVPRHRWKQWETGERSPEILIDLGPIDPREWCFVMRRRRGMTLAQLASESGFAARWVHRAERGVYGRRDIEPLVFWWECQLAVSSQPK